MSISKAEHDELCCVYAGLLLFDEGMEITADKIQKIIKASGNTVDDYYPEFFAKYLASADIKSMLTVSPAAGAGAAAPSGEQHHEEAKEDKKGGKKDDKKGKEKKKEPEKPKEEEEEMEGLGDIFG